jgi:hypothetical protein
VAGTQPGFDRERFENALRFVWKMADTPVTEDQAVFHFEPTWSAAGPLDADQVPFDPAVVVDAVTPLPRKVDCAVEYIDAENQPTAFGLIAPSKVRITLLEADYQLVKNAKYVVIAGDRYDYRRTEPPRGLFDAGLRVMHFTAENET